MESAPRKLYGCYQNVPLSDEEYTGLSETIPELPRLIDKMSCHCESTGRTYRNYAATLRKWYFQDEDKKKQAGTPASNKRMQAVGASVSYADLPDLYQQMGEALNVSTEKGDFKSLGECIDDYIRKLDEKPRYFKTGISSLDNTLHLARGNYFLIGGRPSAGKTALSLQIAANMAQAGHCVCYFSLETDEKTLTERLIANRLYAPLHAVKNKTVSMNDLDRLADCKKYKLYIRSAAGQGVAWIKAQTLRMKADVIFIDYLQLLRQAGAKDRYTAVTQLSMDLHELAQTTGVLVIALAQLSRNAAHAEPTNADLRESGQLEQDADAILLLSADGEEYYSAISKNKEGEIGYPYLDFDTKTQRFTVATCGNGRG